MSLFSKTSLEEHRILVVEDSPTQAEHLRYMLEQQGYQVSLANNGRQALKILKEFHPSLVISDINMPEMNGYELCKILKEDNTSPNIPVILLTSLSKPEDVLEGLSCGADSFITKPFSTDFLLTHIQQVFANWKLRNNDIVRVGVEVLFAGKRHFISADQQQMLGLLISTYEAAVQRNNELVETQRALGDLNDHLEDLVEERTAKLSAEIDLRKQVEATLRETNDFNTLLLQTSPLGMDIVDEDGKLLFVSPAMERLIGQPGLGLRCWDLYKDDKKQCQECPLNQKIDIGETNVMETSGVLGGKIFEISHTGIVYQGKQAILEVFHDITHRIKAEQDTLQRLNEMELLNATSQAIKSTLNPYEISKKILDILMDRFQWNHAFIFYLQAGKEKPELLAFYQMGLENEANSEIATKHLQEILIQPEKGFVNWVIRYSQIVYCGDVSKDERYLETVEGIQSCFYVPLISGDQTIGCLGIESEQLNGFTETNEWLISTLASLASSALENARLFEETERRLTQVQSLHTIDNVINDSMDLRVTLDVIFSEMVRHLGVDAIDVLQFNYDSQTLVFIAERGFRTNALKYTQLRLGEGYAGMVGQQRKLVHITDLKTNKTDFQQSPNFGEEGFDEYYGLPLIAKGQLVGVLEVFFRSSTHANHEWLDFLQTLAGQSAIAIGNSTLFNNLQRSNAELSNAYDATIEGWSRALDLRDKETEGHTLRVTELTMKLVRTMAVSEADHVNIRRGALLHDIGKISIPDEILHKPGPLSDEEWVIMRHHPQLAFELLSPIRYLQPALDIPYYHHEKWDGTGYPLGLKAEEIPFAARIFAVVDVYDALTSDRPYRKAWTPAQALEQIKNESGSHFDPQVVDAFLRIVATDELNPMMDKC